MLKEIFPPIETALELEPEELAPFVLKYLDTQENINIYNLTLGTRQEIIEYAGDRREEFLERLAEACFWLEKELFIAPTPGQGGEWRFITRKGKIILEEQDFELYRMEALLSSENLDAILVRKVKPLFIRGNYDTAIFQALKEVEIRVRQKGGYPSNEIGVPLMRKAFRPGRGPLADRALDLGEQQAICELFAGAIGSFKNPSSHRDIEYDDPKEAADIIHIANQLLRIVDKSPQPPKS